MVKLPIIHSTLYKVLKEKFPDPSTIYNAIKLFWEWNYDNSLIFLVKDVPIVFL